ncbi:MAG: hypothetical protein ACJAYG_002409 [Oceanicoccus sp.]|jgi:hypothetical protein
MAGLPSRFRNAFGVHKHNSNHQISDDIDANQPSTFILPAQYGIYTTIIGNIDDKKALTLAQKLMVLVVEKSRPGQQQRTKPVPRSPAVITKLLPSLRDLKASAKDNAIQLRASQPYYR